MTDTDTGPAPGGAAQHLQALGSLLLKLEDTGAEADARAAAAACGVLAEECAGRPAAHALAAGASAALDEVAAGRAAYGPALSAALLPVLDALASALGFGPALAPGAADPLCEALVLAVAGARVVPPAARSAVGWPRPGGAPAPDVLAQFVTEAAESLQDAEAAALELEQAPASADALARLFRAVHSLKGTADYVGLAQIRTLAHRLEDMLALVRSGRLALESGMDLLFRGIDHLKAMVKGLSAAGEADRDLGDYMAALTARCAPGAPARPAAGAGLAGAFDAAAEQHLDAIADGLRSLAAGDGSDAVVAMLQRAAGSLQTAAGVADRHEFTAPTSDLLGMIARLGAVRAQLGQVAAGPVTKLFVPEPEPAPERPGGPPEQPGAPAPEPEPAAHEPAAPAADGGAAAGAGKTMRVDQRKLDEYLNLAGELVIARNSLVHALRQCPAEWPGARGLKDAVAKVDRIVGHMQDNAMGMRMVPVGTVFQRLPRLIRDVARTLGKKIELRTAGEDTELDKQVAEALSDPLVHLVRNSADHGIERGADRLAAGKPESGTVTLRAGREGNAIVIDIEDDGAGINTERLKAKAVSTGVISAEQAASMTREAALELIFAAGLSTAKEVSDISGRGVGMDVVRNNIAALGGAVTVHSELGRGTRIRLALPLTLAVTTVVLVEAGGTTFGLPMDAVKETVKIAPDTIRSLRGTPAVALRGEVIPLRPLPELLGLGPTGSGPRALERIPVVVLSVAGARFGVVVDALRGQQEIVLKPVPPQLGPVDGVGGATIMGDGSIVLILDPAGLHRTALRTSGAEPFER